ncbi:MAG: hypothetical protein Q9183_003597 [Haloplaca sp. 2 TL-2023]
MAKGRAPKTWAEEIADLDDPAPRDLDPEQPANESSSEDDNEDDPTAARGHYLEVGSSKLRKRGAALLGPEYSGARISRDDVADELDDDPFASDVSRKGESSDASEEEGYDDPDEVELDNGGDIDPEDEIDSDEAFGEGDEETYSGYAFRGSKTAQGVVVDGRDDFTEEADDDEGFSEMESLDSGPVEDVNGVAKHGDGSVKQGSGIEEDEDMEDMRTEDEGSSSPADEGSDSGETSPDEGPLPTKEDRTALRKMMAESQKAVTSNLSQAAKSDVAKGRAVRHQRTAFDSLLNTRVRLQKALVAANSMSPVASLGSSQPEDPAVAAAERAALRLWSTLDSLRDSLSPSSKPKAVEPINADSTPSLPALWARMKDQDAQYQQSHRKTLDTWALKTAPISSLPRANKFSTTPTQRPLSTVLDQQLQSQTNMEKLIAKTQVPRSCAPLQAAALSSKSNKKPSERADNEENERIPIYDDADFYSLLLRDLLDSRSSHSSVALPVQSTIPGTKDPALRVHKKTVDTKASKGRKMRYNVHEKLQNFMAPEDRGTWGERQASELFAGLFGQKAVFMDEGLDDMDVDVDAEEEGLRLFRR